MRRVLLLFACIGILAFLSLGRPTSAAPQQVELRIYGYTAWTAGGPASLRIIAYDPSTLRGVSGVPVEATLVVPGREKQPLRLVSGTTNDQGSLDAQFTVPAYLQGAATLKVAVPQDSPAASEARRAPEPLQSTVQIRKQERVFLSTDKPLYQPGQAVHVRVLALREPTLVPVASTPVTIEVEDGRANKVFKHRAVTSRFGVVSAKFDLATEVNMGEYHVRCRLGADGEASAEKSFTVKKYQLPKFKIAVKTEKSYYLPKEKVRGTIQADYFFGKPVAGGKVTIDARTFDVDTRPVARIEGVTNASGSYTFEFDLPDYFVGQPLEKGKATLSMAVNVQDPAQHREESGASVAVVSRPIQAEVIPESGHLVPGLPNKIYFLTTLPDGSPVSTQLKVSLPHYSGTLSTDATGFGEITYTPRLEAAVATPPTGGAPLNRRWKGQAVRVASTGQAWVVPTQPVNGTIVARDARGTEASIPVSVPLARQADSILIRPDRALYRVGDGFHAQIFSSKKSGSVYVDLIRDNQTIMTRSVDLAGGRGEISFALTPETFGAIQVHAYQIQPNSDIVRDTRKIFVQPAKDLVVTVKLDRASYRPGEDSKLTFFVKDAKGAPTLAVLGVDVVDESLFALAERQPGLERVYFLLEKELMASRYEVHGLTLQDAVRDPEKLGDARAQRYSQALLTKVPEPHVYSLRLDSFDARLQGLMHRMIRVQQAVYNYRSRHGAYPTDRSLKVLVESGLVSGSDLLDPWGNVLHLAMRNGQPQIYSSGPDGRVGTADDLDYQNLAMRFYAYGDVDDEMRPMGGAVLRGNMAVPAAAKVARQEGMRERATEVASAPADQKRDRGAPQTQVRVREFFPETLFVAPEVVTDENGKASLTIPMADSITTWRMQAFASSITGKMGNTTTGIRVFQDFFVDIDAPVSLTQNDEVSLPVAVYNYLSEPQSVSLTLQPDEWYELLDGGTRTVKIGSNEVTGVSFRIRAKRPGTYPLTLHAKGTKLSDAVRRPISVVPDGREFTAVTSDRLQGTLKTVVRIPQDAVPEASKMLVTLYPGIFSQVVEGLDSILRMPGGCFEQTSSSTYPNVLVTRYLKKMRKTTPELLMKAEGYINAGYQRLLTFEVPGGGFSVFGQAPANPILTAYGLMEFHDMSKVHEVDPNLLARTKTWLLAQQGKDGSWGAGKQGFYAEGWSNVPNSNLVATAYITWALLECGEKGPRVASAIDYIKKHLKDAQDPYTAALVANAMVNWDPKDGATAQALQALLAFRVDDKDVTYWRTRIATAAYGTGRAGDIETTALATLALLGSGNHHAVANRAIGYLVKSKDAYGTWQSTQATILAMKAFIDSIERAGDKVDARVTVLVNGQKAGAFHMTPDNFDVFHQVDVSAFVAPGENQVTLAVEGKGNALYKIATHYWRPWKAVPPPPGELLAIDVAYDRTRLAKDDVATCTVKVRNLTKHVANQVMVDVGVPPGFDVRGSDLEMLVKKGVIQRFSLTGRQVVIYLDKVDAAATLALSYQVKARYPVKAQAPASRVYEYYNPDRQAVVPPQVVEIR